MRSYAILAVLFLCICNSVFGNSWVARYSGFEQDEAYAMAIDSNGNAYVTGASSGDYLTVKYDQNGNEVWESRYNGPSDGYDAARAIAVDNAGNVYVTGNSYDSTNWDDYLTIKYDPDGSHLWASHYDGPGNDWDEARAIAVAADGNVYVTGASIGSEVNSSDYATVKYNSGGTQQWASRYNGPGSAWDEATALALDSNNNVYVTGMSVGSGTGSDYATIKYNSSGVAQWSGTAKRYDAGVSGDDAALAIAVDGNVYVTGRSYGTTEDDYATIKYNSSGSIQWGGAKRYDGPANGYDSATAIVVDSSGNVYVTGYSPGIDSSEDYATLKYNSSGTQQWVTRYNGMGNGYDGARAIAVDGSGNVYVTGQSFGSDIIWDDYATIKYDSSGTQQWEARYNGNGHTTDNAIDIALDNSGNVYVTGTSAGAGTGSDYATIKNPNEVGYCLGPPVGDLNYDCKVDFADFGVFVQHWLDCNYEQPEFCS